MTIHGHKNQRLHLERLAEEGRVPPSLIFAGPSGIGKFLVAREFAKTLLCLGESPAFGGCGRCNACALFEAGNHPDLATIACDDRENSSVEAVRDLLNKLSFKPFLGGGRVCIFREAEALPLPAANVLLKNLEEPRDGQYFMFVTSNPSRFPMPLLSRSRLIHFGLLTPEELAGAVRDGAGEPGEPASSPADPLALEALYSEGTMELVLRADELSPIVLDLSKRIGSIIAGRIEEVSELASSLAKDREKLRTMLQIIRIIVRKRMIEARDHGQQHHFAVALDNTLTAERAIYERNLAPVPVLMNLLLALPFTPGRAGATLISDLMV